MRQLSVIGLCMIVLLFSVGNGEATDSFPEFKLSPIRIYIPIAGLRGAQEDIPHEVGLNFSYNLNGQLFLEPSQGPIQTLAEGFSGTTDKRTPWKTLTELLAAYHNADIDAIRSVYTDDSQADIDSFVNDPQVKTRFIDFMQAISGMKILLGYEFKDGFLALIDVQYGDSETDITPYYLVKTGETYLLSSTHLDDPMDTNIAIYLQQGHTVADLPAPKHGLTIKKTGTGDGTVRGSGIDCGEDCIEVFVEGTAVWLKADSDEYSTFEGWLVDGQPLSDRLVIKEDTTVTAVFEKVPPKEYTLTIEMAGTGTGIVTDSDAACEAGDASCLELFSFYAGAEDAQVELVGLNCGEICNAAYTEGTTVYLHATADEGAEFVEWQINGETVTEPVEIANDTTLTAVFDMVTPTDDDEEETPEEELSEQP